MNCPYCGKSMKYGKIYGTNGKGAFWLPEDSIPFHFVTRKNLDKASGIALAKTTVGFIATENTVGYHCIDCKKMIIDVEKHSP
ncbi:MAG: PF20097 family protein [Christensenellales bacterium]